MKHQYSLGPKNVADAWGVALYYPQNVAKKQQPV